MSSTSASLLEETGEENEVAIVLDSMVQITVFSQSHYPLHLKRRGNKRSRCKIEFNLTWDTLRL